MSETVAPRRVVVVGADGAAVGEAVAARRGLGERAAGFVGTDLTLARAMGEEVLGGVDEVVWTPGAAGDQGDPPDRRA